MTPLERLLAEELPTGQVPDYALPTGQTRQPKRPWTPAEQAAHRDALLAALAEKPPPARRHLHALPPAA
ncbi:hypothetical protein [Actinacidiphila sp. ITFR-21]|uniref:hypothetical protein n=1 Tax=Actinacidiphila sp. ITFR-21 TaxID=3075199 RepID=UPI00288B8568|nr:hypothetical protein [Streptomyces sp. ITFR-21]WNI19149.1 hypothetical protein RLT57_28840 [Streptomyces sp. ITFR-21]